MFDPSLKKKKKKKKTGFDLDAALGGESGVTEAPPAEEEHKNEQVSAPVSEKIDGRWGRTVTFKFCVCLLEVSSNHTTQVSWEMYIQYAGSKLFRIWNL